MIMAKALLIAEKPSLMREIQDVYRKIQFPDQIDFKSFAGHTMTLYSPEDYEEAWAERKNPDILPMIPGPFRYKPTPDKLKMYQDIKTTIENGNYDYLINACDPGREGQHIFHSFYETIGCRLPVKRMWHGDLTEKELERALRELRDDLNEPALSYMTAASKLRASFDWLIGMNFSRAFSIASGGANVPVGRVMTPVLKIVVDRELELRNFKPKDFWEVEAEFSGYKGTYFNPESDNETRFFDQSTALALAQQVMGKTGTITSLEQKRDVKYAPKLHALADIQNEANKVYGFTMAETLEIVQELYEAKIVSYPRTDSPYITEAIAKTFPQMLKPLEAIPSLSSYVSAVLSRPDVIQSKMKDKKYVDNKKVSDHYAITPTGKVFEFGKLTKRQQQVLELIAKRLVAIFLPPIVVNKTSLVTVVEGHSFKTNGSVLEDKGYSVLYGTKFNDNQLPPVALHEVRMTQQAELLAKQTTPPGRYTDETLNKAMENAGRFIEDEELKEVLKTSKGIGTPATRGGIVEKLVERKMLERRKKSFYATDYGVSLISGVGLHSVASPELTGIWEEKLLKIEACELEPSVYYQEMLHYIQQETQVIKGQRISVQQHSLSKSLGTCPICGKNVVAGKNTYFCQGYKPTDIRTAQDCSFASKKQVFGASLTETDIKQILAGKETRKKKVTFKNGPAEGHFFYDATTQVIRFRFANQTQAQAQTPKTETKVIGTCPCCGKRVLSHQNYYLCESYKKDCLFIIGKISYGAPVSEEEAIAVLNGKPTEEKTFQFKNGSSGQGRLYYDQAEKKVKILFPQRENTGNSGGNVTVLGACPKCKGRVVDGNYYRCENYKKTCDFILSKTICQAPISAEDVRLMLSGKETPPKSMVFNSGKPGTACLYLEGASLKFKF